MNFFDFKHLISLSIFFSGMTFLGPESIIEIPLNVSILTAFFTFNLYLINILFFSILIYRYEFLKESLFLRAALGAISSSLLVFVIYLVYPLISGYCVNSQKFYLYGILTAIIMNVTTFMLFYLKGHSPSETIESLKIEINVYMQILYLAILAFIMGLCGSIGLNIFISQDILFSTKEIILLFYVIIGVLIFIVFPVELLVNNSIEKLRQIEESMR